MAYQIIEGFKAPGTFSADRFRSAIHYKPKPGDLFISTYPRCGTHWTQHIVYLILYKGQDPPNAAEFYKFSPFLDMFGADAVETMWQPGLIKTHLPYHLTPQSPDAKYIYVCRNPKDCAVSMYHFQTKTVSDEEISLDQYIERFVNGDLPYGSYFKHVKSWYEHKDDPNVLFLTYEEMKEDQQACVHKIATFLGKEYEDALKDEPDLMEKILKKSSFDHMKETVDKELVKISQSGGNLQGAELPEGLKEALSRRNVSRKAAFLRKGVIGDWRNTLSEEHSERINVMFEEWFKDTDLEQIWKKYI